MITAMPRILVVDDDPVSLAFLAAAIEQLGCVAIAKASGSEALNAAAAEKTDLLLLDRHLPDIDGPALLELLRQRGAFAPAIATSAELDAAASAELRAAGFVDVLPKPTTLTLLLQLLHRHLDMPPVSGMVPASGAQQRAILDDASALAAVGGDPNALKALRALFAQELDTLERNFPPDPARSGGHLHRLRASCGFCGANLLADAVVLLERALRIGDASASERMVEFQQVCRATRQALEADSNK
jgi:two-component system OmpR family response regulator